MWQLSEGIADDLYCVKLLFSIAFLKNKTVFLSDRINGIL